MTARHSRMSPWAGRLVVAAGETVVAGAVALTAHGLIEVALASHVPSGLAWIYPLVTDVLALVAYAATRLLPSVVYAWTVVILAAGLSGLAQATYLAGAVDGHVAVAVRAGVGAWPAVAAAVAAHLVYLSWTTVTAPADDAVTTRSTTVKTGSDAVTTPSVVTVTPQVTAVPAAFVDGDDTIAATPVAVFDAGVLEQRALRLEDVRRRCRHDDGRRVTEREARALRKQAGEFATAGERHR